MTKQLSRLRRDERFVFVDGDAMTYRYLWASAADGFHTVADSHGDWKMFEDQQVVAL